MKRNHIFALMPLVLVATSCANNSHVKADTVVLGTTYTAEEKNNVVQAFAIKDGKYIYVGNESGVNKYIEEGTTKVINNNNGLVIPGATEGHGHYFDGVGINSQLPGCYENYEKVLQILKEEYKKGITQFVSFGWNSYSLMEKIQNGDNFANEIEEFAPNIPVVLIDNSGHSAIVNKTALTMSGIDEDTIVRGGTIKLDKDGKPSGYVSDQVVAYVLDKCITENILNETQYRAACEYGMNELLRLGYTNALDAYTNMIGNKGLYKALKKMDDEKLLKINLAECFNIRSYDNDKYKSRVDQVVEIVKNYSSAHLHPEYIKIFADGVMEAGSGWTIDPYENAAPGKEHGNIIFTEEELNYITDYANKNGVLIHAHTYGDGACKAMLDAYIASNTANKKKFRNCLAHVRNIADEDVIRAANNKIPVAENLIWHTDYDVNLPEDKAIRDSIIAIMGEERYLNGYPMKSLMDKGVIVSSSTDAPAAMDCEGSIMNVLEISCTGLGPDSGSEPFAKEECLSIKEGLKALTINGAYQLGIEKERGSIKVGKYADFVILDTNILDYEGQELRNIHNAKILNTYFEGEKVYSAPNK